MTSSSQTSSHTASQDTLTQLVSTIRARRSAAASESYTAQLLSAGVEKCARKMGEEAVETIIASLADDADALSSEAADLIFHLLVLLEARDVPFEQVLEKLAARAGTSGLAEKAARATPGSTP